MDSGMIRPFSILTCGLLLLASGCRSTPWASGSTAGRPLGSVAVTPSLSPGLPNPPKPAVALYIPGKNGSDALTPDIAPPATLAFGGDPKTALPEVPGLPPLPVGDPLPPIPPPPLGPPTISPPLPPVAPPSVAPSPVVPPLPPPTEPPVASDSTDSPLRALHAKAVKQFATMDSYVMRLKRREVVNGTPRPEEIMLCKVRQEPFSVYFKWLGAEGKGREVVFVKGQHGGLIHSLTAAGDVLFLPGGNRFKVAPDSFLVKSKSRYPITEAGIGSMIARFGRLVDTVEKGDSREGTVKYLGELKRPEFENKVAGVQQTVPPRSDPNLPKGGQRLWFFDTNNGLPVLLIATEAGTGREVEYYCHDRFLYPANLTNEDFNPDLLWKSGS